MSWWIALMQDGEIVQVPHHEGEGGTYRVGGGAEARLNTTYNYAAVYRLVGIGDNGSLYALAGQRAGDLIPAFEHAVERLGTRQFKDYWAPTPGNAGHALNILLGWMRLHPDAVFEVS